MISVYLAPMPAQYPTCVSHKEIIPQSFRRKDIRTINLFDREDLYSKSFLLSNLLFYPTGTGVSNRVFTLPLSSSLQLRSNYKRFLEKKFRLDGVAKKPLLLQRRDRLLKNHIYRKIRFLPIHFFGDHRKQKLFRMRYKRLFSTLSKIFIEDNLGSRLRAILKHKVLHKHLSKIANKKKV